MRHCRRCMDSYVCVGFLAYLLRTKVVRIIPNLPQKLASLLLWEVFKEVVNIREEETETDDNAIADSSRERWLDLRHLSVNCLLVF